MPRPSQPFDAERIKTILPFRTLPLWIYLPAGPFLFALTIIGASVVLAGLGMTPDRIATALPAFAPHILLAVLAALGLLVAATLDLRQIWAIRESPMRDTLYGSCIGASIGLVYFRWLSPLLHSLRRDWGDYVSPGSVTPALSSQLLVVFVANVGLAPLVEETLYRGHIQSRLQSRFGIIIGVAITVCFLGCCTGREVFGTCWPQ